MPLISAERISTVADMNVAEPGNHKDVRALCSSVMSTSLLAYATLRSLGRSAALNPGVRLPPDAPARTRPRGISAIPHSFPRFTAAHGLQREQNLTGLTPKRPLITGQSVKRISRQVTQADKRHCEVF